MAQIILNEGDSSDIINSINSNFSELYTAAGLGAPPHIITLGNWGTIRTQINSMYQELMLATVPTTIIATAAIAGVTAPITGATPVATLADGTGYSATISWSPSVGTFGGGTVYTATITLTPKTGYTLTGVTANFFTVAGATATNPINSGVVSAVFPTTTAGPDTLSTGLISYWKMDDASTPVVDSMGINNGVATGCTFSQASKNGTLGTSILFNGISDVIIPPNDNTFPADNFSCSAWVKASTTSYGHGGIFSTSYGAVTLSYNYNAYLDTRFAFCVNQVVAQAGASNWDTNWHFLVGTYDRTLGSNNIKLYVDGTLNAQANDIVGFANSYINIGRATGNGEFFPGYIDEVGIWGKVLTQAEITELYNSGSGKTYPFTTVAYDLMDGLISYYEFEEVSGTTVLDSHASNNGTTTALVNQTGFFGKAHDYSGHKEADMGNTVALKPSGAFSITAWYTTFHTEGGIMGCWAAGNGYKFYQVYGSGVMQFTLSNNWIDAVITGGTALNDSTWHHVAATFDGTTLNLYVDGVTDANPVVAGLTQAYDVGRSIFIGSMGGSTYAEDLIDDVGIWNRVLSAVEVSALYNNGNGLAYSGFGVSINPQNLVKYSEQLNQNSVWYINNGTVTATNIALDLIGNMTMDEVTFTNVNHSFTYDVAPELIVTSNTTYRWSFDVIRGTMSEMKYSIYDRTHSADIIASTSYYSQTSGSVQRVSFTFTTPAGCLAVGVYFLRDSGVTGTAYFGRAQVESNGSSYIATTTSKILG